MAPIRHVAVFDFDATMAPGDSLFPLAALRCGPRILLATAFGIGSRAWHRAQHHECEVWADGDSAGDPELLALADHASRVPRRGFAGLGLG